MRLWVVSVAAVLLAPLNLVIIEQEIMADGGIHMDLPPADFALSRDLYKGLQ
jgi:hypothetical protein